MKKIETHYQSHISGGHVGHLGLGFCAGLLFMYATSKSGVSADFLNKERTKYYEDGFAQGYNIGRSDGLTIAVTGTNV
jgi:hypothetical protein